MIEEHPFAKYIRTLGKGKRGQRSLSQEEAHDAASQILAGNVDDVQLGAFLMLMRVKEETPAEIAGFVQAVKESLDLPKDVPPVSIDWSSYAGKRRQLPWNILSAVLLSKNGYPVFMHGLSRNDERVYAEQALKAIGITASQSFAEAVSAIKQTGFAYLGIEHMSALLNRMIELRQLLGLRSPGHTMSRILNPLSANLLMQGIFHPGYAEIHQQAAQLLKQPLAVVFKGEGGEIERNPDKYAIVFGLDNDELYQEEWVPVFDKPDHHVKEESLDLNIFKAVWNGEQEHEYGEAAVISTAAIAIKALGIVTTQEDAMQMASQWWSNRLSQRAA